ncbi:hypothetical protein EON66_01465 [archaeon]|nr:MAG: hypothetical protein EON66_01465 [archaeon]
MLVSCMGPRLACAAPPVLPAIRIGMTMSNGTLSPITDAGAEAALMYLSYAQADGCVQLRAPALCSATCHVRGARRHPCCQHMRTQLRCTVLE